MKRGFTFVELLIGMGLMALLVLGSMSMLIGSMRSFQRTDHDTTMADQTARTLRKIVETVRPAVSVTITNSGRTLTYNLPALTAGNDPVTGEKEVVMPPVSDGVSRSFTVDFGAGTVTDSQTGRVIVRNVCSVDPDTTSSLYNQAYQPFQLTTIGTNKALTINIITRNTTSGQSRTMRMKTTTILPNLP